jgi:hypothetical protein
MLISTRLDIIFRVSHKSSSIFPILQKQVSESELFIILSSISVLGLCKILAPSTVRHLLVIEFNVIFVVKINPSGMIYYIDD